ncbi:sigma-70 family RNA polymerase sigma factor [Paenibacillus woosongensis]|uniref:Sigma-70 family RNA polymerase sigma factor n=1 Tax=Paenibacillus woosongensis TaxID=307580 RepID=A0AA95I603_9BACL|nr:sigma-70 family RNA polymerase sigma factor [Paenibacillus woosongensis]WHX47968.1 sigma-70 family RNA polymerase sigma factor [Paenibacillus woosongensis]
MKESPELWLAEIAEGSVTAFSRFYDAYAPMVYRLAEQCMKNAAEAEDVCHDVFIEIMDKAGGYNPARGSVEAWLAVRTRSRALDRLRKQQRWSVAEEWSMDQEADILWSRGMESAEYEALRKWEQEQLKQAMQAIPPMQRMALHGSYIEQLSHREIAEHMKRPVGTVKSLIRYGIRNLRRRLDEMNLGKLGGGVEPYAQDKLHK